MKITPIASGIEQKPADELREYRVTVTNGNRHVRYTTQARSWYCAWSEAINKYGIPSVVCVRPVFHDAPAEREQLCLV